MGGRIIDAEVAVRSNKRTETAVERGLVTALLSGSVAEGARVMSAAHVPLEVAKRVLLHPEARRSTDWTQVLRQRF